MLARDEEPKTGRPGEAQGAEPPVLTVGQLTAMIKETLESVFMRVWVSGEISDISRPQSGHVYFTLKDSEAQIRGVMWCTTASRLRFNLEDGLDVICCGDVDVYPPRGSYQLVVRQMEPRGVGALQLALRQLQQRLAAEGLFDPRHKKPLPQFPRRIALVTSPSGAAIRDFLEVLRRRWLNVEVLVIPVRVQGDGAAGEIAAGIGMANRLRPRPDVLVVTRGGGSLEDLWSFNEEAVVRAIFAAEIPVISAVGHEIDVTLSDLVADVRALTPSEAAERVVPSCEEVSARLQHLRRRLGGSLRSRAAEAPARLAALEQRRVLRKPYERLANCRDASTNWKCAASWPPSVSSAALPKDCWPWRRVSSRSVPSPSWPAATVLPSEPPMGHWYAAPPGCKSASGS